MLIHIKNQYASMLSPEQLDEVIVKIQNPFFEENWKEKSHIFLMLFSSFDSWRQTSSPWRS